MLKTLISAVTGALRTAFRALRSVASIPAYLAAFLLGGAAVPAPAGDSPLVEDLKQEKAEADAAAVETYRLIANAIWKWAMDSLVDNAPAPVPSSLPRAVKNWLPGLSIAEAEALISADKTAIEAHVRGIQVLASVRPVQPLIAGEKWSAPEPASTMRTPEPTFLQDAIAPPRFAS